MASAEAELLIIAVVVLALGLSALASKWISEVGGQISAELDVEVELARILESD